MNDKEHDFPVPDDDEQPSDTEVKEAMHAFEKDSDEIETEGVE
jgi:hypothetical protein